MSALDDMLAEFESNAGTMPQVNPPEAPAVLAAQTAPEVAGQPEPAIVEATPPAPTEKPADVKAAEAAKTRKPRGAKNAGGMPGVVAEKPAAPPEGWDNVKPITGGAIPEDAPLSHSTEALVRELARRGFSVALNWGG